MCISIHKKGRRKKTESMVKETKCKQQTSAYGFDWNNLNGIYFQFCLRNRSKRMLRERPKSRQRTGDVKKNKDNGLIIDENYHYFFFFHIVRWKRKNCLNYVRL